MEKDRLGGYNNSPTRRSADSLRKPLDLGGPWVLMLREPTRPMLALAALNQAGTYCKADPSEGLPNTTGPPEGVAPRPFHL